MRNRKSFVLTSALPSAASDDDLFDKATAVLKDAGYDTIEFFADFDIASRHRESLIKYGMEGVFLAAGYQKKNKFSLCSLDENRRRRAIDEVKRCIDAARSCGAGTVLITSGAYPGTENEHLAWDNLGRSVKELSDYCPEITLTLEPGDRSVDAMQLAGPTEQTVIWTKQLISACPNFQLTMDTSHIAQLGESIRESIPFAREVCSHIHLANCILKPNHPLYGDKHPLFGNKDAVYDMDSLKHIASEIYAHYPKPVTLTVEIINRSNNEWQGFLTILEEEKWFSDLE